MKKILILVLFAMFLLVTNNAFAIVLGGEYSISASATPIDADSWTFSYAVTNINQQVGSITGLDGFFLQVPSSAFISNRVPPPSYSEGGWWTTGTSGDSSPAGGNAPEAVLQPGNVWLTWWGVNPASVYPIGTTVTFGFQADGVSLGTTIASPVTYWDGETPLSPYFNIGGGKYTVFSSQVLGPSAVPEPATLALFGIGSTVMAFIRKKKNAA